MKPRARTALYFCGWIGISATALYAGDICIFNFDAASSTLSPAIVEAQAGNSRPAAALNLRRIASAASQLPGNDWIKSVDPVALATSAKVSSNASTARTPAPSGNSVASPVSAPIAVPFTYVGAVRTDGASSAVAFARGERVILVKQGETVDGDFKLVALSPPTVLHVASGTRMVVPAKSAAPLAPSPNLLTAPAIAASTAPLMSSAVGRPSASPSPPAFNARDTAAIEAEVARALAALPPPPTLAPSSFPLAR